MAEYELHAEIDAPSNDETDGKFFCLFEVYLLKESQGTSIKINTSHRSAYSATHTINIYLTLSGAQTMQKTLIYSYSESLNNARYKDDDISLSVNRVSTAPGETLATLEFQVSCTDNNGFPWSGTRSTSFSVDAGVADEVDAGVTAEHVIDAKGLKYVLENTKTNADIKVATVEETLQYLELPPIEDDEKGEIITAQNLLDKIEEQAKIIEDLGLKIQELEASVSHTAIATSSAGDVPSHDADSITSPGIYSVWTSPGNNASVSNVPNVGFGVLFVGAYDISYRCLQVLFGFTDNDGFNVHVRHSKHVSGVRVWPSWTKVYPA